MSSTPEVLLLVSDPIQAGYLRTLLQNFGCNVHTANKYHDGFNIARNILPQLLVLDSLLQGVDWKIAASELKRSLPHVSIFLLGRSPGDEDYINPCIDGCIRTPINYVEFKNKLLSHLKRENDKSYISDSVPFIVDPDTDYIESLILGQSKRIMEVKNIIKRVAETDVTVLLRGESGTGKELAAQALYRCSKRRKKPFVKVLCAAIPEGLLESELFGHEKGAFTGAHRNKPGKFEFANGGTIFLDEIGDIPHLLQVKLLQVLQDGEFSKVGGREVKVDVRVIAATNRNLEKGVVSGHFREDLFYRLNVVSITMPTLRERKEDIPLLTESFLHKYCQLYNKDYYPLSRETMDRFMAYNWPGNVRELENMIKRIIVLGSEEIDIRHAEVMGHGGSDMKGGQPPEDAGVDKGGPFKKCSLREIAKNAVRKAEEEAIKKALVAARWNKRKAAELLSISYKTLFYKMKEYNLFE